MTIEQKTTTHHQLLQNKIGLSNYNYKLGDNYLNKILNSNKEQFTNFIKENINNTNINIPLNFDSILMDNIKHNIMFPYKIVEECDKYKLFFDTNNNSTIFSKYLINYEKTEFILEE